MNNSFKYNIETYQNLDLDIETHISCEYNGESLSFNTGVECNPTCYSHYKQDLYKLDSYFFMIFRYVSEKHYKFKMDWIELTLYNLYIQSLVEPEKDYLKITKMHILDDMNNLEELSSFNCLFRAFLFEKYGDFFTDEDNDLIDPTYEEYSRYHRLFDCFVKYQLENNQLLLKNQYDLRLLFSYISNYLIYCYKFDLTKEFKEFIEWSIDNKLELLSKKDNRLVLNDKVI